MRELSLYHFAGAPGFLDEMRSRFAADDDGVATVGDAVLTFGKIDAHQLGVFVESGGEAALVVQEDFVDAVQHDWED